MKRGPLIIGILIIELIVAFILFFNYQYIVARLRPSSGSAPLETLSTASEAPSTTDAPAAQAATSNGTQGQLVVDIPPAIFALFSALPAEATPLAYQLTEPLVTLGRTLFYDPRLSVNKVQSCNTCHPLNLYGMDGLPVSRGHDGMPVTRNAPTLYNAALHLAQFWDGRSPTVEEQAKAPIVSSGEMGMLDPEAVEATLKSIPGYTPLFAAAFPEDPDPITFDHVAQAIGAFERRLMTPARFDRFLAGDYGQLNEQEQRGFATFVTLGCPNCHVGVTVGGLQFKKLGEKEPYPIEDVGRFAVTGLEMDKYVFKVPSLRNVAKTAPYLHNGSIQTLEEMVTLMARYQLGKQVTPAEVTDIIAFFNSLTGEISFDYIAPPPLPQ
ncbi:MAG: cytochrome c peroxidase [Caldilineaceae bacterium]